MKKKTLYADAQDFFKSIIDGIENGTIEVNSQAKCVGVEARLATPEEVGTKFMVWSHGKIEKEIIVQVDTVFLTTLDRNGKPIVDEGGHKNTYDMPFKKFARKYKEHINGHYVQTPSPRATIQLPDNLIAEEGIKLLPPCWEGYAETLMRGGLIMLPLTPNCQEKNKLWSGKSISKMGRLLTGVLTTRLTHMHLAMNMAFLKMKVCENYMDRQKNINHIGIKNNQFRKCVFNLELKLSLVNTAKLMY